ncbi:MAG: cytochrome c biogenesis protein CcdA [Anaerolineales bacterium]
MNKLKDFFVTNISWLIGIAIVAVLLFVANSQPKAEIDGTTTAETTQIFFSAGCADCWPYVQDVLQPALQAHGLAQQVVIHDYTIPEHRTHLLELADEIGLPRSIADSLYAFIPTPSGTLVLLGHVPADLISELLELDEIPSRLVVWQPEMHADPKEYRLWAWTGEVQVFPIDAPLEASLAETLNAGGPLPIDQANLPQLLPAVIITGLIDSVNPCAFAVILLLVAFLFTLRQSRARIWQLGLVYIGMIFIVYFAIGLGLLRAIQFSTEPHFVARVGTWILIGLGVVNLIEYFFPRSPIKLHMPDWAHHRTHQLIGQASLPATITAGFLVGLCTFPCSGGIYVSILTLLNAQTTAAWGLAYLVLYNILFVLPLLLILAAVGNRTAAKAWAQWERSNSARIRLWYGVIMIGLGLVILFWMV